MTGTVAAVLGTCMAGEFVVESIAFAGVGESDAASIEPGGFGPRIPRFLVDGSEDQYVLFVSGFDFSVDDATKSMRARLLCDYIIGAITEGIEPEQVRMRSWVGGVGDSLTVFLSLWSHSRQSRCE